MTSKLIDGKSSEGGVFQNWYFTTSRWLGKRMFSCGGLQMLNVGILGYNFGFVVGLDTLTKEEQLSQSLTYKKLTVSFGTRKKEKKRTCKCNKL